MAVDKVRFLMEFDSLRTDAEIVFLAGRLIGYAEKSLKGKVDMGKGDKYRDRIKKELTQMVVFEIAESQVFNRIGSYQDKIEFVVDKLEKLLIDDDLCYTKEAQLVRLALKEVPDMVGENLKKRIEEHR